MIELAVVTKRFGDVVALSGVSFEMQRGITALVGPNGAGKSTIIRLICGLTTPSSGTVKLFGESPRSNPRLYGRIGLVPQQEALFDQLSGIQFVGMAARLHRKGDEHAAIERVGLDPKDGRPIGTYSKGMRQRIKVAQALVGDPEVLILDEPLNGLDPVGRREMIELFRDLSRDKTILVSSHVLSEVEMMGSRVLVLVRGKLAAEGDFRQIRELLDDRPHRIRVRCSSPAELASGFLLDGAVNGVAIESEDSLLATTRDVSRFRIAVASIAKKKGIRLLEISPQDDDLESVFGYLVGSR